MAILPLETDRKVAEENDAAEGAAAAREVHARSHALPLEGSLGGQGKGLAVYRRLLTTRRYINTQARSPARVQCVSKAVGDFLGHRTLMVIDWERMSLYSLKDARFGSSDQILPQALCRASQRHPQLSVQPGASSVRPCHGYISCRSPAPPRTTTPNAPSKYIRPEVASSRCLSRPRFCFARGVSPKING